MTDDRNTSRDISSTVVIVLFLASFVLGMFSLRGFLAGQNALTDDAAPYIESVKFFTDNISRGIYPLWDPTREGGIPNDFYLRRIGEFNPFYWIIIFLEKIGLPFYRSYLCFLVFYLFIGMAGFYKLSRCIFRHRSLAFLAYLLLMCSTFPTFLFRSFVVNLFVPMAWFFYFLYAFLERQGKHHFLGMTFALMIIGITYIPFYFLTIFLFLILCFILIYPKDSKRFIKVFVSFGLNNRVLVGLSLACLVLSLIPGILFFQDSKQGDLILPARNAYEVSFISQTGSVLEVPSQSVVVGGIPITMMLKALFSDFEGLPLGVFYAPTFIFLLFLLGLYVPVTRRLMFFYIFGFIIYVVSLYDATPVYQFLYRYIFFFKFFRNFQFFFLLAIVPVFIFICVDHLRIFLESLPNNNTQRRNTLLFVIAIHLGFAFFLYRQGNVNFSSYIIVAMSLVFFINVLRGRWHLLPATEIPIASQGRANVQSKKLPWTNIGCLLFLTLIIVVQAQEVFYFINRNARKGESHYRYQDRAYLRYLAADNNRPASDKNPLTVARPLTRNPPGDQPLYYFGLKSVDDLYRRLQPKVFWEYLNDKFIVYDRVQIIDDSRVDYQKVAETFVQHLNVAFVSGDAVLTKNQIQHPNPQAQRLSGDTDSFKILDYDVNTVRLKTNFKFNKFLVYNDGFYKGWQARVNNRPVKIVRANLAFKGFWVPAGENTVILKFGSPLKYAVGYILLILFPLFLTATVILWARSSKEPYAKN